MKPHEITLRERICAALVEQGYILRDREISLPGGASKDVYRALQHRAVSAMRSRMQGGLKRHQADLLSMYANGADVDLSAVHPEIVEVMPGSWEELIFRFTYAHWNIPISRGYGRRLRYLVIDRAHEALMGIVGLCDPVFALRPRDEWVGWTSDGRLVNLKGVLDAFVMGAVPPYSALIYGKFIASTVFSKDVQNIYTNKYGQKTTLIAGTAAPNLLTLVTTTSAFGRSSIYNKIRFENGATWQSLGYTMGTGDFHFNDETYRMMRSFVEQNCIPTAKNKKWGAGFRNKREVIKKCLSSLGLSPRYLLHGIKREVLGAELGRDARKFLRGEADSFSPYNVPLADLHEEFRARWAQPRAQRRPDWRQFQRDSYALWDD